METRMVHVAGRRAVLTFAEFETLLRLMEDPGRVLTREALRVLPGATLRAVDVQILRTRRKLAGAKSFAIEAVPHVGYRCFDGSE
jgi:DNA-binding response OmpR family regulator